MVRTSHHVVQWCRDGRTVLVQDCRCANRRQEGAGTIPGEVKRDSYTCVVPACISASVASWTLRDCVPVLHVLHDLRRAEC